VSLASKHHKNALLVVLERHLAAKIDSKTALSVQLERFAQFMECCLKMPITLPT
jgi:hypothetical protein